MSQPLINRQPQKQQRYGDDGHLLLGFGGVFFCLFIALWAAGIDIVLPSALFISALLGFLFASALVHNAHLCLGLQIVLAQLFELLPTDDALSNGANGEQNAATGQNKEAEEKRNSDYLLAHETTNYIAPPWERIRINAQLNRELEELFETLLDCYVSSWYTDLISTDTAFLLEVRHLIRHSSAKLINRLISVDLHSLFINDLFPLVLAHVERICRFTNAICRHENRLEIAQMPASLIEYKVLDRWSDDVHWAMRSSANCDAYMRTVADLLIRQFVDDIRIGGCFVDEEHAKILSTNGGTAISSTAAKWSCHSSRHFLRELLFSSVLVPAMDFVADPDTLNRLTLSKLNDDDYGGGGGAAEYSALAAVVPDEQESSQRDLSPIWQEPFLARFVEPYYTNMPDSLLGLKLNDLVENQYLTKLFEMYLRDLNGPTHLLDCFVQAREIHLRIQTLNSAKFGVNSENHVYQRESSEICFDAWQLFSTFVHSNGPNRIPLDGRIEAEFLSVLELNGRLEDVQEVDQPQQQQQKVFMLKPLEKVIEAIYQQAYQNLQYNYVIPFWQSENYLGYLCGAPPDVDELISGPSDDYLASRRVPTKIPEGSFSLAQFRKKLFNFITPAKDIPSSSASSLFHQSSFSSMTAIETLGGTFASAEVDLDCVGTIAMADLSRDMAKWSVTIDGVAQRRANQQTVYHIYSLSVERNDLPDECYTATKVPSRMPSASSAAEEVDEDFGDADNFQEEEEEDLPKVWTVGHRCEEFFALEDRLREHCGNTFRLGNSSTLPDRKTTLQMLQNGRNNRALMETYRIHFERFLNQLLQQPSMKRSDLLYIFLTSEENSTGLFELVTSGDSGGGGGGWRSGTATNFLPDLNPIRAMRKVGGKERGQNLKPFILNLLANTLAPPMRQNSTPIMMQQQQRSSEQIFQSGDTTSIKSETATARSSDGGRRSVSGCSNSKPCSISAYNFPDKSPNSSSSDDYRHRHSGFGTGNFYDLFLFFSLHLGLIARFPIWLEALLCSLRTFVGFLLSIVFRRKTEQILNDNLFNVQMAIYLVRSLHELILFQNVPSSSSSLHATPSQNSMTSAAAAVASGKQTTTGDKQKMQRKPMTLVAGTTTAKSAGAATKSPAISEQERKLRAELALHCLEKWVERTLPMSPFLRWIFGRFASVSSPCMAEDDGMEEEGQTTDQNNQLETSVRQLFLCFQMSTLNRQLAFVLMDKLLQKIVIEKPQTADYGAEANERRDDTGH
uniref:PXA domain-containing protein n=1 Tax=Globodera rostochiensis TaxID=31243 RepID=A0A914H4C2_GLORO